jgi:Domain of unknown function (DUF892)
MFEHSNTPEEIFSFKLGSALTMEQDSLKMLETMADTTPRPQLKELFRLHASETRQQIENIKQCFALLGKEVNDQASSAADFHPGHRGSRRGLTRCRTSDGMAAGLDGRGHSARALTDCTPMLN